MWNPIAAPVEPKISIDELPARALAIYKMRPDLKRTFDLGEPFGRRGLYWWYFLHGFREMWLDCDLPEDLKGPINKPVDRLPAHGPIPVNWTMRQFWRRGYVPDSAPRGLLSLLARLFRIFREPVTRKQQEWLIAWHYCCGLQIANLTSLVTEKEAAILVSHAHPDDTTPHILAMAHSVASDLHDRYPTAASSDWHEWCASEGRRRFRILDHPAIKEVLFPDLQPTSARAAPTWPKGPFGVNIFGHARGRSGVAEDVRMAARALEAVGVPFTVHDLQPSSGIENEDDSLAAYLTVQAPFGVNMFCMAGMETVTAIANRPDLLDGRINIGFWPWELAEWPELWKHAPRMMDEIWASTMFTAFAYRRATDIPVRHVPMAVAIGESDGLGRLDFGLPEDRFLFGFAFDGHSSFSRKNPADCVLAFSQAFPRGDEPVGLVLKGLRVDDHPAWRELELKTCCDPRIHLISKSLTRGAILDLYRSIDCFASLHRSEGFGRNLAECMLLGKPVIATNYSGNTDFTRPDTAALVEAEMRQIVEGEYPFGTGQVWAAPSINLAAQQMKRMFVDERWRTRLANAGQTFIATHYAPAVVGAKFRQRLEAVAKSVW